jgi:ADP-ribose pyrophosphatase YjhB (NUDIX family)
MPRDIRYQGAIVRDHQMLLIRHQDHATGRSCWVVPGGGREAGETEEACVAREMSEETGLTVTVERLVLEETDGRGVYQLRRTYLCTAEAGEAQPGYEPEPDAAALYGIAEVRWFDLRDPASWDPLAVADPITHPQLQRLRAVLGYDGGEPAPGD